MNDEQVCKQIFAITAQCLLMGHLPTQADELMHLFKDVAADKETIKRLARENKLYWVRAYDCERPAEEYRKSMNKALLHYLKA